MKVLILQIIFTYVYEKDFDFGAFSPKKLDCWTFRKLKFFLDKKSKGDMFTGITEEAKVGPLITDLIKDTDFEWFP